MASNTTSITTNNVCKYCSGMGGSIDAGHWYDCPYCSTSSGASAYYRVTEKPVDVPGTLPKKEAVKHPEHYKHPSGIECIDVVQHMGFNLGNAVKYIWRADLKNDAIEDMKKAIQYLEFEIEKRTKGKLRSND